MTSQTPEMDILGAWYNQQIELIEAAANAIQSLAIAVHRADVRTKMKNKRPRLRQSSKIVTPLRRYVRNNPDAKWIFP